MQFKQLALFFTLVQFILALEPDAWASTNGGNVTYSIRFKPGTISKASKLNIIGKVTSSPQNKITLDDVTAKNTDSEYSLKVGDTEFNGQWFVDYTNKEDIIISAKGVSNSDRATGSRLNFTGESISHADGSTSSFSVIAYAG